MVMQRIRFFRSGLFKPTCSLLLALVFSLGFVMPGAGTVSPETALEEGFALQLAAIAPANGWDSPEGKSADAGMQLVFRELNTSRKGLLGREVLIEKRIRPSDIEEARRLVKELRQKGVMGIICFASGVPAHFVAQAAAESGMPLILCHSETLPLGRSLRRPHPFLFGLDLDKSFRPLALAAWAGKDMDCPWFAFIDRVDPYLSRQGERTEKAMQQTGIKTELFWFVSGSVADIMGRLTECTSGKKPNVVSWMSPLMTLRVYATARKKFFSLNLIHGDTPSNLLRTHEGIQVIDQDTPLQDRTLLGTLGDRLWARWGAACYGITEEAARGALAAQWFRLAFERLPSIPQERKTLARSMEKVEEIGIEEIRMPLSSATHRPAERQVAILRSKDNRWQEVDRITIRQE